MDVVFTSLLTILEWMAWIGVGVSVLFAIFMAGLLLFSYLCFVVWVWRWIARTLEKICSKLPG